MKIIKISAIWCSSCLVMQKVWEKAKKEIPEIEWKDLDLDFDSEAKEYQPGNILPVLILEDNGVEVTRLVGERSEEETIKWLKENIGA